MRDELIKHFGKVLNKVVEHVEVLDPLVSIKFGKVQTENIGWYLCYALSQYVKNVDSQSIVLINTKDIKQNMKEWIDLFEKKTVD